jgi:hypothetical protein
MLASRLTNLQAGLEVAQAAATRQLNPGPDPNELPVGMCGSDPTETQTRSPPTRPMR